MIGDSQVSEQVVLATVVGATATSAGLAAALVPRIRSGLVLTLDVTSAAVAAGDTLDVFVQTLLGNGMWVDVVHFTQVLGNGSAKRHVGKINPNVAQAMFENAAALAAGSVRNLIGDQFRVRYDIVTGTAPVFSFTVTAQPQ